MSKRYIFLFLAIGLPVSVFLAACIFIGVAIWRAPFRSATFAAEVDGVRPLIGGFELAMLKSFPRQIIEKNARGTQILIPPDDPTKSVEQVGKYFEWPPFIAGHIEPFVGSTRRNALPPDPTRKFFVLNLDTRRVDYFATKEEGEAALKAQGVNLEQVKWRVPDPGM